MFHVFFISVLPFTFMSVLVLLDWLINLDVWNTLTESVTYCFLILADRGRGAGAAGGGSGAPPLPLLHGCSVGAEKCPFAM